MFKRFYSLFFILLLLVNCSIKNPAKDEAVAPMLSDLFIPGTLYLQSTDSYPILVKVTDPQGWIDITSVRYSISIPGNGGVLFEGTFHDDGMGGDIIPRDGIYHDSLSANFTGGQAGTYRIGAVAEDRSGHLSDTLYADFIVEDGEMNRPPRLWNPVFPDSLGIETVVDVFFSIQAEDAQGLEDIDTVLFEIYPPYAPVPSSRERMWDNGTHGDTTAGDGVFSYRNDMREVLKRRGYHTVRFVAIDKSGIRSDAIVEMFFVRHENSPPVLSDLAAPDTVSRSNSPPFLLSVRVIDPQGPDDIKTVFFNSTKPDGSPSGQNPFIMFDDGMEGDEQAGDNVYSLTVEITPNVDTGEYRFDFLAEDHAGAFSDTLAHIITVVE